MSSPNTSQTLSPLSTPDDSPTSFVHALSPTATVLEPNFLVLPDLVSHCPFSPTFHDDGNAVAAESLNWILSSSPHFTQSKVTAMHGLKAAELCAYCYNNCPSDRLRVASDFMNLLFHLDDVSDGYLARDAEGFAHMIMSEFERPDSFLLLPGQLDGVQENRAVKLARDFWSRFIPNCSLAVQQRFKLHMEMFFQAVHQQACHRTDGSIPDVETFILARRETSACKPLFDLIEYSLNLELPGDVVEHPVILALSRSANDYISWSNDLFSYNVEQARGDTHNIVSVFMIQYGLSLQQAVDRIGEMCKQSMETFIEDQERVPSWGDGIDRDVELYVRGLKEWMVGCLHWSFVTKRYFGDNRDAVKTTRIVDLLSPKKD